MKWAKSRNAKNSLQRVEIARHDAGVPRGELGDDPRRGRPDVVDVQLGLGQAGDEVSRNHPPILSLRGGEHRIEAVLHRAPLVGSPSTRTVGVPLTFVLRHRVGGVRDPLRVDLVLDQRPYRRTRWPRPHRGLDQLLVLGAGRALRGLVGVPLVVERLERVDAGRVQHGQRRVQRTRGVVVLRGRVEEGHHAVLHGPRRPRSRG